MPISITRRIISSAAALEAVEAAVAKGREHGAALVAAVVDISGDFVSCLRADGAFSASVTIARDKAYTAAVFGVSTDDLSNALKDNPVVHHGIALRPGVVLFGGGLPIFEDGAVIGAIGVSGGSEDDDRSAAAAGAVAALHGLNHPANEGMNVDIKNNIDNKQNGDIGPASSAVRKRCNDDGSGFEKDVRELRQRAPRRRPFHRRRVHQRLDRQVLGEPHAP
jgi:uncharacterized protein GlcG (DUF336 family)